MCRLRSAMYRRKSGRRRRHGACGEENGSIVRSKMCQGVGKSLWIKRGLTNTNGGIRLSNKMKITPQMKREATVPTIDCLLGGELKP